MAKMIVKFAVLCDYCNKRSLEYEAWPHCIQCLKDTCSSCDCPSERTDDERNETLCQDCLSVMVDV